MSQRSVLSSGKASIHALEKAISALEKSVQQPRDDSADGNAVSSSEDAAQAHGNVRSSCTTPCKALRTLQNTLFHDLPEHFPRTIMKDEFEMRNDGPLHRHKTGLVSHCITPICDPKHAYTLMKAPGHEPCSRTVHVIMGHDIDVCMYVCMCVC
jgi:hypothetical protein